MTLLDRISIDPEIVHGRAAVRGTRMRVSDVLSLLAAGADEDEILEDYPYLNSDDIRDCLAYPAALPLTARLHSSAKPLVNNLDGSLRRS